MAKNNYCTSIFRNDLESNHEYRQNKPKDKSIYQFTSFSACFHVVSIILLVADLSNDKMRLSAKSSSSSDRTV